MTGAPVQRNTVEGDLSEVLFSNRDTVFNKNLT